MSKRNLQIAALSLNAFFSSAASVPAQEMPTSGVSHKQISKNLTSIVVKDPLTNQDIVILDGTHRPHPTNNLGARKEQSSALTASLPNANADAGNGIEYHGGPVLTGPSNVFFIWYGSWNSPASVEEQEILINLVQTIGGSAYFQTNTTYKNGDNVPVSPVFNYAGSVYDNYSLGSNLKEGVAGVIGLQLIHQNLPEDPNAIYIVATSDQP